MLFLIEFIAAMAISIAVIPFMIHFAPRLGMMDLPDPRKVRAKPITRVVGVGIVFGALIPLLLWVPLDEAMLACVFVALVLLAFGAWDDIQKLGHYVRFMDKFVAAIALVYYSGLHVAHLPFNVKGALRIT